MKDEQEEAEPVKAPSPAIKKKGKRIVDSSEERRSLEDDFQDLGVSRGRRSRRNLKRAPISEESDDGNNELEVDQQ